jgi:hypothetical protein
VEELESMVADALNRWNFDAFTLDLRQMVESDPSSALAAIDRISDIRFAIESEQAEAEIGPEILRELRASETRPALVQILEAWATQQPLPKHGTGLRLTIQTRFKKSPPTDYSAFSIHLSNRST